MNREALKERWEKIATRIDALTLRERAILFVTGAAALFLLLNMVLLDPLQKQQGEMLAQIKRVRADIELLDGEARKVLERQALDPDAENKQLLADYQQQIARLEQEIREVIQGVVSPQEMAKALEKILVAQQGLTLVRVESLGSEPLIKPESDATKDKAAAEVMVYRHGLRLEVTGSYLSTLSYLQALKAMRGSLYWDSIELDMEKYPQARVVMVVHTLSMNKGWIGV